MKQEASVAQFRAALAPATRATVDALRAIVASAHPALSERIKWNAPSFVIAADDRITLGLERAGGVRLVLHRGAKPKEAAGFSFDDPDGLARWPSPDRGIVVVADLAAAERQRDALGALCRCWIEQTG